MGHFNLTEADKQRDKQRNPIHRLKDWEQIFILLYLVEGMPILCSSPLLQGLTHITQGHILLAILLVPAHLEVPHPVFKSVSHMLNGSQITQADSCWQHLQKQKETLSHGLFPTLLCLCLVLGHKRASECQGEMINMLMLLCLPLDGTNSSLCTSNPWCLVYTCPFQNSTFLGHLCIKHNAFTATQNVLESKYEIQEGIKHLKAEVTSIQR